MKLNEVLDGIFYVGFRKREFLANTFMKFYGYYENPKFKGKIFTEKQFERWFRLHTEMGEYGLRFMDIAGGFNLPDYVFSPFFEGKFELNKRESELLQEISKIKKDKFIVISSLIGDKDSFDHELSHGLFYMNRDYKMKIVDYFKGISRRKFNLMENVLMNEEIYSFPRLIDEMQANLMTRYNIFMREKKLDEEFILKANQDIQNIFGSFYAKK